jgi:hypothetical protein
MSSSHARCHACRVLLTSHRSGVTPVSRMSWTRARESNRKWPKLRSAPRLATTAVVPGNLVMDGRSPQQPRSSVLRPQARAWSRNTTPSSLQTRASDDQTCAPGSRTTCAPVSTNHWVPAGQSIVVCAGPAMTGRRTTVGGSRRTSSPACPDSIQISGLRQRPVASEAVTAGGRSTPPS